MRLEIEGHHRPGRGCRHLLNGTLADNVHVGIQVRREPAHLFLGDSEHVQWTTDVSVRRVDGGIDFAGESVQGKRGDRFVDLCWVQVADDELEMFRRAKLMLHRVDQELIDEAERDDRVLRARVHLTDESGLPRCARVDPPPVAWSVVS